MGWARVLHRAIVAGGIVVGVFAATRNVAAQDGGDPPVVVVDGPSWTLKVPAGWKEISDPAIADDDTLIAPRPRAWAIPREGPTREGATEETDVFSIYTVPAVRQPTEEEAGHHRLDLSRFLEGLRGFEVGDITVEEMNGEPAFRCEVGISMFGLAVRKGVAFHFPTPKGVLVLQALGDAEAVEATEARLRRVVATLELSTPTISVFQREVLRGGYTMLIAVPILIGMAFLLDAILARRRRRDGTGGAGPVDAGIAEDQEELERVRAANLQVERLLRGWGKALVILYALYAVVAVFRYIGGPLKALPDANLGTVLSSLSTAALLMVVGRALWLLHPVGRILLSLVVAVMIPGLFLVGGGALAVLGAAALLLVPLVLAWTPQGGVVFTERYRSVVMPATPQVKPGRRAKRRAR